MSKETVITLKRYLSDLDSELVLATVSVQLDRYFVEVIGEQRIEFASALEAMQHAEAALKNFYVHKSVGR